MTHKVKRISNDVIEQARQFVAAQRKYRELNKQAEDFTTQMKEVEKEANALSIGIRQGVQPFYTPDKRAFVINLDGVSVVVSRDWGLFEASPVKDGTFTNQVEDKANTIDDIPF